jgi:hypothetical protein
LQLIVSDDVRSLILYLLFATSAAARVAFVTPQTGAQALGPQAIEITTDATDVDRVEFVIDGALAGVARKAPWRIAHDFGTSVDPHTIAAVVWSRGYTASERAEIRTAAIAAEDAVTIDLVEVPLRVRGARPVTPADLRVRENGVEQSIRDVHAERGPASFVFVVDRSLSMGDGKLAAALRAIHAARAQLRPGDTASVILFNHNVAKPRALDAMGEVTPNGGTSLRDAVASIPAGPRTYAFVLTDGGDRNSELDEESALRRISNSRTVIDALILGESHTKFLDRAAKNTGGTVVDSDRGTVARDLRALIDDINSRYTLVYQSRGTAKGWRAIEITARRGITIAHARKGYFAS